MNYWCFPGLYNTPSIEGIISRVCAVYKVQRELLFTNSRKREIVLPRQICMWLAKRELNLSLHKIGDYFNKDHASVLYACNTIDNLIETNKEFRNQINQLL